MDNFQPLPTSPLRNVVFILLSLFAFNSSWTGLGLWIHHGSLFLRFLGTTLRLSFPNEPFSHLPVKWLWSRGSVSDFNYILNAIQTPPLLSSPTDVHLMQNLIISILGFSSSLLTASPIFCWWGFTPQLFDGKYRTHHPHFSTTVPLTATVTFNNGEKSYFSWKLNLPQTSTYSKSSKHLTFHRH